MTVHFESELFNRPIETQMQLLGKMQAQNAAMAAVAIKKLLPNLDEGIIERGIAKAKLPGRFEILENVKGYTEIPALILDGAHTLNSIRLYKTTSSLESPDFAQVFVFYSLRTEFFNQSF